MTSLPEARLDADGKLCASLCLEQLGEGLAAAQVGREAQSTAERLEVALAAAEARAAAADMRLAEILASSSWRLTHPLRTMLGRNPVVARMLRRTAKLAWWLGTGQLLTRLRAWRRAATLSGSPPAPAPVAIRNAPVTDLEATVRRLEALERHAAETQGAVERLDARERHAAEVHVAVGRLEVLERHAAEVQSAVGRLEALEQHAAGVQVAVGRVDALERHAAEAQGAVGRVEVLERRTAVVESLLDLERNRVDWSLAGLEGTIAQIDAYHSYRETDEYRAAYATAEPLVSVCVATMDRAELLVERCVASLRMQSYRNLQIVVVGDNCTDDTSRRLAALGDSRVQFVNLPERGPYPRPGIDRWYVAGSNAMNHALSLCEGQFVTHLDDDDSMVPHRVESMLSAAMQDRADFLWHPFWYENRDGTWTRFGDGRLELGQITTGSIFYHRYFARFPWDVHAYRLREPGDWNRLRKIRLMRARLHYVDEPLLYHHAEQLQAAFVAREGERFLE